MICNNKINTFCSQKNTSFSMRPINKQMLILLMFFVMSSVLSSSAINDQEHHKKIHPQNLKVFVSNNIEFVTVCFQKNSQGLNLFLPQLLIDRAYSSLNQNEISCFRIMDKLSLLEQPNIVAPTNQGQKGRNRKQLQYLGLEYELIQWVYQFGQSVSSSLSRSEKGSGLQFSNLQKFNLTLLLSPFRENKQGSNIPLEIIKIESNSSQSQFIGKVQKKLIGKGLHQQALYTFKINNNNLDINQEQCYVQLTEVLTHQVYIDTDELQSHKFSVRLGPNDTFVDVEAPAYKSRQYEYRLTANWGKLINIGSNQYSLRVPLHFRYPTPYHLEQKVNSKPVNKQGVHSDFVEFVVVDLYPISEAQIVCRNQNTKVFELQIDYLSLKGSAKVPVGDGSMKNLVNIITLGSEVLCAVLLVRKLKK